MLLQFLFQSCICHQNIAIPPGSLPAFDCNQSVVNLHIAGGSVLNRLLCCMTKPNNIQEDADDLVQIRFLMRYV